MNKFYTIGQAAKLTNTTTETLRHYDRIKLVNAYKDENTNYRYYKEEDIIKINIIKALQLMDVSLEEIKEVLEYEDLNKIVAFLDKTLIKVNDKISLLERSKEKILNAKKSYISKLEENNIIYNIQIKELEERNILLSDSLEVPTTSNLYNYLSSFYNMLDNKIKDKVEFYDYLAGIYIKDNYQRLFAVVKDGKDYLKTITLAKGKYLCLRTTKENYNNSLNKIKDIALNKYNVKITNVIAMIIIKGILEWDYELEIYLGI